MLAPFYHDYEDTDSSGDDSNITAKGLLAQPSEQLKWAQNKCVAFCDGSKRSQLPATSGIYISSFSGEINFGLFIQAQTIVEGMKTYSKSAPWAESETAFIKSLDDWDPPNTNNLAEVCGIIQIFLECLKHNIEPIVITTDSQYVVSQIVALTDQYNNNITWNFMQQLMNTKYKAHGWCFYFINLILVHTKWPVRIFHIYAHVSQKKMKMAEVRAFLKQYKINFAIFDKHVGQKLHVGPYEIWPKRYYINNVPHYNQLLQIAWIASFKPHITLSEPDDFTNFHHFENQYILADFLYDIKEGTRITNVLPPSTSDEILFENWLYYGNWLVDNIAQGHFEYVSPATNYDTARWGSAHQC